MSNAALGIRHRFRAILSPNVPKIQRLPQESRISVQLPKQLGGKNK